MLLPTGYKWKIGKAFGWPVGAEAVSSALAEVPQAGSIDLVFHKPDTYWPRYNRPSIVFEARYRYRGPSLSSPQGSLDGPWHLVIRAVPRRLKHRVKVLLLADGLPLRVRPWLTEHGLLLGREGEASITLRYDEDADCLVEERWSKFGSITRHGQRPGKTDQAQDRPSDGAAGERGKTASGP